jgi:hypothetical protein
MYSTEEQAKNGFKTFVVTLAISLVVFGGLYYLITGFSDEIDIEDTSASMEADIAYKKTGVQGRTTSVFQEISEKPVNAHPAAVLAGADEVITEESTESTTTTTATTTSTVVPGTGSETLIGTMLSISFFTLTAYTLFVGPRKFALKKFEEEITSK